MRCSCAQAIHAWAGGPACAILPVAYRFRIESEEVMPVVSDIVGSTPVAVSSREGKPARGVPSNVRLQLGPDLVRSSEFADGSDLG